MSGRELPDKSRDYLIRVANLIREGFTGTLEIHCNDGGIRRVHARTDLSPDGNDALDVSGP